MSKAFTKEEQDEEPDEPEIAAPQGSPVITRAGYDKLQAELEHLWKVERPKVTNEVMWAAAQGDRSENAEYIYGKRRLREIDRRLRFLKKRLDALQVVEPHPGQLGRVFFGATVTIEDEDGKRSKYRIVGSDEIDTKRGWISIDSPLAKALLGKKKGDFALVMRPKGETEVQILAIAY
jgi:transcription elongation factor GreB